MSTIDLFALFGLPLSIIAASVVGLRILNSPKKASTKLTSVAVDLDAMRRSAANDQVRIRAAR